jgi:ligand-binding sensor domain-containing protein/signal transduction histidine kinase
VRTAHRFARAVAWLIVSGTLLVGVLPPLRAADNNKAEAKYSVDHWGVDQGLLYENVGSMLQGRDGYLWIGTDGGVERFDGVKFVVYRMGVVPGLVGDSVRSMMQDSSGALWIGTNRGLSRYADGKFEIILEAKSTSYTYAMCEDAAKTIWIGTQFGLRTYRDHVLSAPISDPLVAGKSIVSVFYDSQQRLWIGMSNYGGVVCHENGVFREFDLHNASTINVLSMAETPRGILWFGTNGDGLTRYDSSSGALTHFAGESGLSGKTVTALDVDREGTLWIGALGLHRFDAESGKIERVNPMSVPSIRRICHDNEGSIWSASYGDGLYRVRPARYKILNSSGGLPGDFVRTMMQDTKGTMWLAQSGQGAVKIAADGTVTRIFAGDNDKRGDDVLALWTTRAGVTFIGGQHALAIVRNGVQEMHPEFRAARALFEDSHGTVWLGPFEMGLRFWKDGRFSEFTLPPALRRCTPDAFAEDTDGTLWVGTTTNGLLRIRGSDVTVFDRTTVLPSDEIRAVYLDRDRNLWIGTKRGMALCIDGNWYAPSWLRDFVDEHVSGVVEIPNDYLLISTTHGVVRFGRKALLEPILAGTAPQFLAQTTIVEAGRIGSIGAACFPYLWKTTTGEVWIAARRGAVVIDPRGIGIDTVAPPVRVEQLTADGKDFGHRADVELAAGTRQLTIEYSAITFVQIQRVFFKYQLEGYETAPVEAESRRVAFYNNLPPGRYTFRVTACNGDGVWNPTGATLSFRVLPFFYQTWWFRVGAGVAALAGILGFVRWRLRRIQRHAQQLETQNEELEQRIAERTAELAQSLEQLKAAQRELLESSRLAGMAEVAAGVLHNIGNALNSVNVSADVARNRIRHLKVESMDRVARLLEEQGEKLAEFIAQDPRGRRLPEYLRQLSEHFAAECKMTAQELDALCTGVEHMKAIVAAQQELTHATEVLESVPPPELVDYALQISSAALGRHHVTVTRDFQPVSLVHVQRQKTLQILINLINNAKEAVHGVPLAERKLVIKLRTADDGFVEISVTDNGAGIAAENLSRIFTFGFTTKKKGHGFGLHSSALTAKELGGELRAESEGVGRGANFILRLPPAKSDVELPASTASAS